MHIVLSVARCQIEITVIIDYRLSSATALTWTQNLACVCVFVIFFVVSFWHYFFFILILDEASVAASDLIDPTPFLESNSPHSSRRWTELRRRRRRIVPRFGRSNPRESKSNVLPPHRTEICSFVEFCPRHKRYAFCVALAHVVILRTFVFSPLPPSSPSSFSTRANHKREKKNEKLPPLNHCAQTHMSPS